MVGLDQVDLGEDSCPMQVTGKVVNVRNWIPVRNSHLLVETAGSLHKVAMSRPFWVPYGGVKPRDFSIGE